jgi:salicylate hydroxylase
LALAKQGHRVSLYEAAPAWADVGAGITLAPNAMRGLDYVGVGEEIRRTGMEPSNQEISHWKSNKLLVDVIRENDAEKYGAAYVYIHRADLHSILTNAAEKAGVEMHLNKQLSDLDIQNDFTVMHFSDGTAAAADLVVGADGLKWEIVVGYFRSLIGQKHRHRASW